MNNLHSKINMKNVLWGIEKSYGYRLTRSGYMRRTDMRCSTFFFFFLIFLTMFSTIFMEMISSCVAWHNNEEEEKII